MCGIIGYTGLAESTPFLVQGLLQLQYRGYDSAGLATLAPGHIERRRVLGSPEGLVPLLEHTPLMGTTGIGHTRWATHGKASVANAHPHLSQNRRVAVVHNGTIENYSVLRVELQYQGYVFASQTDTEVVAHMIEQELRTQKSLAAAVAAVLPRLRGTYALAVISADSPGEIVVARLSSPLLLGFGQGGVLISSDEVGFSGSVSSVLALRDGDIATIRADGSYLLKGVSSDAMAERISPATISLEEIRKGGHPCFMMKEICEQPDAMQDTLRGRILPDYTGVKLGGIERALTTLADYFV
jgi:glucosamine--fructose-6-phosphate aminotransferase (isomerizing)